MGLFRKKADPITDRARALNAEISALEARIKRLNQQVQAGQGPRLRSTVYPSGPAAPGKSPAAAPAASEPIFEDVQQIDRAARTRRHAASISTSWACANSISWRSGAASRKQFAGRPLANPKLINYLAAGSIQGLRPLRYEKRVARNRFFLLGRLCRPLVPRIFVCWLFAHRR